LGHDTAADPEYDFTNNVGSRVRYDYHLTLIDLYVGEYLKTFTDTLNKYGMSSRAQVAYNYLPLNMTRSGAAVDIPENESLDSGWAIPNDPTVPMYGSERWRHAMDSYRLTGSGAHLNKGKRATIEFGADFAIYRKQPVDYAQQLNEACAGGVTMGLLTGFAGIATGWSGSSGLAGIGIGDFWTTAWPQWRDWTQRADYFARSTLVLEAGRPLVDVVIYLAKGISDVHEITAPKFASSALETAGFTYDFIDPVSLVSASATAVNGVLFGNGPSYQALVLNKEPSMPAAAAQTILNAAKSGLTVIVIGDAPSASTGLLDAAQQDALVVQAMTELLQLGNVAQVASADEVASALLARGRTPAASFGESSPLLSVHRRVEQDEDIWWISSIRAVLTVLLRRVLSLRAPSPARHTNSTCGTARPAGLRSGSNAPERSRCRSCCQPMEQRHSCSNIKAYHSMSSTPPLKLWLTTTIRSCCAIHVAARRTSRPATKRAGQFSSRRYRRRFRSTPGNSRWTRSLPAGPANILSTCHRSRIGVTFRS
jgi:alpha-L-rhamnosidase